MALWPDRLREGEADLWLMFIPSPRQADMAQINIARLWRRVINFIVVEHMGKTYAKDRPVIAAKYLKYVKQLRASIVHEIEKKNRSSEMHLIKKVNYMIWRPS